MKRRTKRSTRTDTNFPITTHLRNQKGLEKRLQTELEQSPDAIIQPFGFDIVHGDYEQAFLPFVVARLGQVDKLINNAGLLINRTFGETSIADFSAMLEDRKSTRLNSSH